MSSDRALQCPACRARQPLQDTCRRCGADLQLLAKAKRRVAALIERRQTAIDTGDQVKIAQYNRELRLLQPGA